MHILITGATGFIGRPLTERLLSLSYRVTVLSRRPEVVKRLFGARVTCWPSLNGKNDLNGIDAVINLAGAPIIDKRWSEARKQVLCHSRWDLTQQLATLIRQSDTPPSVLISGSATGYYGDQGLAVVNEDEPPHKEFTHELCAHWEALALQAESDRTRVCLCRTGIVLSPDGGALQMLLSTFRLGLGGPMGNGKQYMPWIHRDDLLDALIYLLHTPHLRGPFNLVSPYPVNNELFSATLAEVLGRPAFFRVPALVLKMVLGEAAVLLLGGQRALPQNLEKAGFGFRFFDLKEALQDLLKRK